MEVLGQGSERLWNTIAFIAPELGDCRQRWVVRLDAAGVAASSGSACSSGKEAVSHVLLEMNVPVLAGDRVLRLSAGWDTTLDEWREVAGKLGAIYERWRPAADSA
jgi:cysteine desulfurase